MLIIAVFILGLLSRLIPHVPNFTPVIAIALFSGAYLNKKYSLWVPLSLYVISDLIMGLHEVVLFTWGSIVLIAVLGLALRKHRTFKNSLLYTLLSAVLFFIITNFGVWLGGWYPHTFQGFIQCYTLAIPFFRVSLIAALCYMTLFTVAYNLATKKIENRKVRFALLLS